MRLGIHGSTDSVIVYTSRAIATKKRKLSASTCSAQFHTRGFPRPIEIITVPQMGVLNAPVSRSKGDFVAQRCEFAGLVAITWRDSVSVLLIECGPTVSSLI